MGWLLIRGLSRERRHWGSFPQTLAAALGDEVETIDPPGFGAEHRRTSPSTVAAITDDIAARFDPGDESWSILGISLGGMVALDWCARRPDAFERCVVVNTSARPSRPNKRFRPRTAATLLKARSGTTIDAERATIHASVNAPDDDIAALAERYATYAEEFPPSRASVRNQVVAATRFACPARIEPPTLVIASDGDRLVDPSCSRLIADALDAPLAVHQGGGHDLALDAPDWIAETIRQWIGASAPEPGGADG